MHLDVTLNPVLERELRARARRRSMPRLLTVFLAIAVLIVWLVWRAVRHDAADDSGALVMSAARAGHQIFEWSALALFTMISFVVPGFTAASITGERERQTLVPMQVSLLRPIDIVIGKMASSAATTLLLTVMAVPMLAAGFAIGGVELFEVVRAVVGLFAVALLWAALSIAASAIVRKTATAMLLSYAIVGASTCVTAIVAGLSGARWLLYANPFVGFADFVAPRDAELRALGGFGPIGGTADSVGGSAISMWIGTLLISVVLGAVALRVAVVRLRTPSTTER